MKTNEEIVAYLNKLKEEQNLSTSEIARRVHMAKSAISNYLNGKRNFPLEKAEDFAQALHTTPEKILGTAKKINGKNTDTPQFEMIQRKAGNYTIENQEKLLQLMKIAFDDKNKND